MPEPMNRRLIIETDIGRDPDDLFALCYLIGTGASVCAITVSPGDPDQIALVKWLLKELGLPDVRVGAGIPGRTKSSVTGMHRTLMQRHGAPMTAKADMDGAELISFLYGNSVDVFVIGPLSSVGRYIGSDAHRRNPLHRVFMQGGFVQYGPYTACPRLPKFEGKKTIGTFNMNGDVQGTLRLIAEPGIIRSFVGKNVCHTIEYTREIHERVLVVEPRNRAMEIFHEGMSLYLQKHPAKLFHDPAAAVCFTHPDIAQWVQGSVIRDKGGWGTEVGVGVDSMAVGIDHERLWQHIIEFS